MPGADAPAVDLVAAGQIRLGLFLPQYIKDAVSGELRGVGTGFIAIELARVLAARLGIELRVIACPTPPKAVECLKNNACDVVFLGVEPVRAVEVDFSPPLFQFDYTYLVPAGSAIRSAADVDHPGVRVATVNSHASALALRRIVRRAELIGAELPEQTFELFSAGNADAFAFPRDQLLELSTRLSGSRVLEDRYGINRVAMAVAKGRAGWRDYVGAFADEAKASGLVETIIARGGLRGFQIAD